MATETTPDLRLLRAATDGDADALEKAIQDGADIECESSEEGMRPLMLAAMNGETTCLALLLAHGADPCESVRESGYLSMNGFPQGLECDAMWFAAKAGSKKCVALLFDAREGKLSEFRLQACVKACSESMKSWFLDYARWGWESETLAREADPAAPAPTKPRL